MDRRKVLLVTGTVLWVAVFISLYFVWTDRANRLAAESQEQAESELAQVKPETEKKTEPDEDDGDGRIVPKLTLRAWSPDGLPEFKGINQDNQPFGKADLLGKPWVASFIFTRCNETCPKVVSQLSALQRRLKDVPVRMVSFSVQPDKDTPEDLAQYAKSVGADPAQWQFLTGDLNEIHRVIAQGFVQIVAPTSNPDPGKAVAHSNNVCLVNSKGVVVGQYNSLNDSEMLKLRQEILQLIEKEGQADSQ